MMSIVRLLDINLLIALVDPWHDFHAAATNWIAPIKQWATCPLTENGFLRIFGHPEYNNGPGSPAAALPFLRQMYASPRHVFWRLDLSFASGRSFRSLERIGCSQITDLYLLGLAWEFIQSLATFDPLSGKRASAVGGPAEALLRLFTLQKETMPLAPTPAARTAGFFDDIYGWMVRNVLLKVVPDVDRYSWTEYVAKGFDISAVDLGINAFQLVLYLLPWAVLAYYLIRSREVASW